MTEGTEMDVDISPLPDAEPDAGYPMDADDIARESAMMDAAQEISEAPSLVDAQPDEAYYLDLALPSRADDVAKQAYRDWMAEQEHYNAVVRRQPKITRLLRCRRARHRRHARRNRGHHRASTARAPDDPPNPLPGSDEVARTVSSARRTSDQRFSDVEPQPFTTRAPVVSAVVGAPNRDVLGVDREACESGDTVR